MPDRPDGRAPDALRPVAFERKYTKFAPGAVRVAFGDTIVLCTATFEQRVPPWLREKGQGWVTAEYAMLPGSSQDRVHRSAYTKGRSQEISRLIGRSLRAVTDLVGIGECQITLDCDVLQADGGTRTAAITGAYVALYDALRQSVDAGFLKQMPLRAPCAAVSVGIVGGQPRLDLCYTEDVDADVDMNIVMDGTGRYIEVQGSAEGEPFSREAMDAMLDLAAKGCNEMFALQRAALELE